MNWFIYFSLAIIGLSFLSSLSIFAFQPLIGVQGEGAHGLLRAFAFFLMFIFMGEIFGVFWPRMIYNYTPFTQSNQWFYTLFHFVTYVFYLWFFEQLLTIKKTVRVFFTIYVLAAFIDYFMVQGPYQLNTFADLLACLMMVFLSIAYYYQLIRDREYVPLRNEPFFWICTGLMIYHLGSMMGLFLINIMNALSEPKSLRILFIVQIAAVLMYLNYAIAYLCMKRT